MAKRKTTKANKSAKKNTKKPKVLSRNFRFSREFINEHPFGEGIVENNTNCFANREKEIKSIRRAIQHCRRIGVEGQLGAGKSTLLKHLVDNCLIEPHKPVVVWIRLAGDSHESLFQQIALGILKKSSLNQRKKKSNVVLKKSCKINIKNEIQLLDESALRSSISGGVKDGPFTVKGTATTTRQPHSKRTSLNLLEQIVNNSENQFLVVLDDFHYLQLGSPEENYLSELSELVKSLTERLNHKNLTMVITTDGVARKQREKLEKEADGKSFMGLDKIESVSPFGVPQVAELIHKRLVAFQWTGKLHDFIEPMAFFGLAIAGEGNPRCILYILQEAMYYMEDEELKYPITVEAIEYAATEKANKELDEYDLRIVDYIHRKIRVQSTNATFVKHVGQSRSNVNRRCRHLRDIGVLTAAEDEKSRKVFYSIPIVDHNY